MHWSPIKVRKLILGHFLPKIPNVRFFPRKLFESILSLYTAVTLCKKSENCMH